MFLLHLYGTSSSVKAITLRGRHVRLEPLDIAHVDALTQAAAEDRTPYAWSFVPSGREDVAGYVRAALRRRDEGTCLPFATVRADDGVVLGSTRFFDLARWDRPAEHERASAGFDTGEIGYTWLRAGAIGTRANAEAKLLMLRHAFEDWKMASVCFCTDERNERSRAAIERTGARFEGILRAHRLAVDFRPRNTARYSIVAAEWPDVQAALQKRLE